MTAIESIHQGIISQIFNEILSSQNLTTVQQTTEAQQKQQLEEMENGQIELMFNSGSTNPIKNKTNVCGLAHPKYRVDLLPSILREMGEEGYLTSSGPSCYFTDYRNRNNLFYDVVVPELYDKTSNQQGIYRLNTYEFSELGLALAGDDGKITKEEIMKLDLNGDGKITKREIEKFKADLINKKATDLYTYLDENGNLPVTKGYNNDEYIEHENLLLSNLYEEIPKDELHQMKKQYPSGWCYIGEPTYVVDGVETKEYYKNYRLNEFGKELAGEDGVISKEELAKLDMDGDGKISQADIDAYKARKEARKTDVMAFLDENDYLPTSLHHVVTPKASAEFNEEYGILLEFFEPKNSCGCKGITYYNLNKYGQALAGADGKISKEELLTLDTNGDGKVTQDEVGAYKEKVDQQKISKPTQNQLQQLMNMLYRLMMMLFFNYDKKSLYYNNNTCDTTYDTLLQEMLGESDMTRAV